MRLFDVQVIGLENIGSGGIDLGSDTPIVVKITELFLKTLGIIFNEIDWKVI